MPSEPVIADQTNSATLKENELSSDLPSVSN